MDELLEVRDISSLAGAVYAQANEAYAHDDLGTLALAVRALAECVGLLVNRLETEK